MKYELVQSDTIQIDNQTLYRIRALQNLQYVPEQSLGGYIASETNLSQDGNCWVDNDARVYGNAEVCDDARVFGRARVYGDAIVAEKAHVHGNARVFGRARVYGDAHVFNNVLICGDAHVYGTAVVCNYNLNGDVRVNREKTRRSKSHGY